MSNIFLVAKLFAIKRSFFFIILAVTDTVTIEKGRNIVCENFFGFCFPISRNFNELFDLD